MALVIEPQPVPLRKDDNGVWRVGNTRVLFELVVNAFNAGRTPEEIIQSYETLQLDEVYSVLAYYLANRQVVDSYIQEQELKADMFWDEIAKREDYQDFRQRILSRRSDTQT